MLRALRLRVCARAAPPAALVCRLHACAAPLAAGPRRGGGGGVSAESASASSSGDASSSSAASELASAASRTVAHAARELSRLRGGAASPSMLDGVVVAAYGERQPLSSLAQVTLKTPTLFVLSPFDAALAPAVGAAVRDAGLGLNPVVEAAVVRVPVPPPSRETREANLKLVAKIAEAAKAAIRRQRQAALDALKKAGAGASSDDLFRQTKQVQDVANKVTDEVTKLADKKRAEIEG